MMNFPMAMDQAIDMIDGVINGTCVKAMGQLIGLFRCLRIAQLMILMDINGY